MCRSVTNGEHTGVRYEETSIIGGIRVPTFAVMVGIEGSGRSRFAREKLGAQGYTVVSSDDVGCEVESSPAFQQACKEVMNSDLVIDNSGRPLPEDVIRQSVLSRYVVEEVFRRLREAIASGNDAAWDGSNLIRGNRKERIMMARRWGADRVVCYWTNLPAYRCAANLANKFSEEGISMDLAFVTAKTNDRHAQLEQPLREEGFDEIIEVTEKEYGLLRE